MLVGHTRMRSCQSLKESTPSPRHTTPLSMIIRSTSPCTLDWSSCSCAVLNWDAGLLARLLTILEPLVSRTPSATYHLQKDSEVDGRHAIQGRSNIRWAIRTIGAQWQILELMYNAWHTMIDEVGRLDIVLQCIKVKHSQEDSWQYRTGGIGPCHTQSHYALSMR